MFGFGTSQAATSQADREAAIQRSKKTVRDLVHRMDMVSPEEAERLAKQVKDHCAGDKLLSMEFKQKANTRARELQCSANMRRADTLLHDASRLAAEEHLKERGMKLGEARRYFANACMLGADADWRKAFQRLTETIMMTGGVQHAGPTRAKPASIAPPTPNRAKG
jgi:hypothetical protein